ncbi:MAG: radical SAM protein [Endomicrobium sp.]|jgi:radical SAM protein with 4Fe4S-binding SPASM domain|nr:radical SAM protein [Endomicrobium sp.]
MEVDLHVTNRCNLKCNHCVYSSGEQIMPDITLETVKKLIPSFKKMDVKEVHITGGEPLLNQEIFGIVFELQKNGFLVRIQTNGILITNETAKKLKSNGADHILISMDGLENFHNNFRNNENSYNFAVNAVKTCLKNGLFTRVNTVVSRGNVSEVKSIMQTTKDLNVHQHSFFYFTPFGRGKNIKDSMFSLGEWKQIKDKIVQDAQEMNYLNRIRIQDVFHENDVDYSNSNICREDNCLILANGEVYHCVFFANSPYSLGNIYKEDIFNIWSGCSDLVNSIISKNSDKKCDNNLCGGGCSGMAYCLSGNILSCDPRCNPKNNIISNCIRKYKN